MKNFTDPTNTRKVCKRIIVGGVLVLESPAHFSNGDTDEIVDMPLMVDALDGELPLLTGASIAGALRAYLYELGIKSSIFGGDKKDTDADQSSLIVEDALGKMPHGLLPERRHGNKINPESGTAEHNALYDFVLWPVGTEFALRFELVVCEDDNEMQKKQELVTALAGLGNGDIHLGARKQRGFGGVKVNGWKIKEYDLRIPSGLSKWILSGGMPLATQPVGLGSLAQPLAGGSARFKITATLKPVGSLIIRAGGGKDDQGPDASHLTRQKIGGKELVLSGTTLGGVLRSRCLKIAKTLGKNTSIVEDLFGVADENKKFASKVRVSESVIDHARADLIQARVRIDRWTGGAADSALYDSMPVFAQKNTVVKLKIEAKNTTDAEKGLLLLAFKDLVTGDLPVGGESSIGRGRLLLDGAAEIVDAGEKYQLAFSSGGSGGLEKLEECVKAFCASGGES